MNCPCETCLTRSMCGNKMVVNGCLILDNVRKCPLAYKYIQRKKVEPVKLYINRIYQMCKIFDAENKYVWWPSTAHII